MADRLGPARQAALRQRLVARTLRYAIDNIEFYKRALGSSRKNIALQDFPIVDKACMDESFDLFTNFNEFPELAFTTGGTTRSPSVTLETRTELDRMFSYAYDFRPDESYPQSVFDRFTLHVSVAGQVAAGPRGSPVLRLPLVKPGQVPLIRRFLEHGLVVRGTRRRVGTLICPTRELKLLTRFLMATDFDPSKTALDRILAYSDHVTHPWQANFQQYWGVKATPVYGLSEFNYAVAKECPACGYFHFPTYVYPEVVSPDRSRVLRSGDGVLLLTSLYPFVRGHPHIRYWTGDVVRIGPRCDVAREPGILFLGRLQHCKLVEEGENWRCLCSSIDVLEACEQVDGIAFEDLWSTQPIISSQAAQGLAAAGPIVRIDPLSLEQDQPSVILDVGVQLATKCTPQARALLAEEILKALGNVNPNLENAMRERRLDVEIRIQPAAVVLSSVTYQPLS